MGEKAGLKYLKSLDQTKWQKEGIQTLDKVRQVATRLGDPQEQVKLIHVGGTNGKGSVCAAIGSILSRAGYSVGLTTSPHLVRINERIVLNGVSIDDQALDQYASKVELAARESSVNLSFFEAITLTAFLAFKERQVDYGIIEVGLGGRLDATNIIDRPVVSVIVTIDLDHQHILGDTKLKIAVEKGGIVKNGVPLVIGEMGDDVRAYYRSLATQKSSQISLYGYDFGVRRASDELVYWQEEDSLGQFTTSLAGEHQSHNMAVAIRAASIIGIPYKKSLEGVSNVFWPCRLERGRVGNREVIFDAAHNPAGIKSLISFMKNSGAGRFPLCFGAISSKEWREMIDTLIPVVSDWSILSPDWPLAVSSEDIVAYLSRSGISAKSYGSDYASFCTDVRQNSSSAPLVVAGSIYMVGKLRDLLGFSERPLW